MNVGQRHLLRGVYRFYVEGLRLDAILVHFTREFRAYGASIHPLLWLMLDAMREAAGVPIFITNHLRPGDENTHGGIAGMGDMSLAVDIRGRPSTSRMKLNDAARSVGFSRIGHYCDDEHIHLDIGDIVDSERWPVEVMFLGKCRG